MDSFVLSRSSPAIWDSVGADMLVSRVLIALSSFVDCSGSFPGTANLAADLFKLCWSFHSALDADVRRAVLSCLTSIFAHLRVDALLTLLEEREGAVERWLAGVESKDPDGNCREIASWLNGSLASGLKALGF